MKIITNYSKAWAEYKKTIDYKKSSEALKAKGIKQPYRDNIFSSAFAAGWNATNTEIKIIKP